MLFLRLLRIHHWSKNILLFLPLILSQNLKLDLFLDTFFGFIIFSIIASCGYIINDLCDYNFDKQNVNTKNRVLASDKISFKTALTILTILIFFSFFASLYLFNLNVIILMFSYLIIVIVYTYILKKIMIVDLIILTSFFILRLIIGAEITSTLITSWLLFFSLFLFLFLAINKRIVELQFFETNSKELINKYNRGYSIKDIDLLKKLSATSGLISVFVLAIYFNFTQNLNYYENIYFSFFLCLLLLIWILRILFLTERKLMNYDPILFSIKDKISWLLGIIVIILFILNY